MLNLVYVKLTKIAQECEKVKNLLEKLIAKKSYGVRNQIRRLAYRLTTLEALYGKLSMICGYTFHIDGENSYIRKSKEFYTFAVDKSYHATKCGCPSYRYQHGTVDSKCKHMRFYEHLVFGNLLDILFHPSTVEPTYKGTNPDRNLKKATLKSSGLITT